jgi:hypothetical protein
MLHHQPSENEWQEERKRELLKQPYRETLKRRLSMDIGALDGTSLTKKRSPAQRETIIDLCNDDEDEAHATRNPTNEPSSHQKEPSTMDGINKPESSSSVSKERMSARPEGAALLDLSWASSSSSADSTGFSISFSTSFGASTSRIPTGIRRQNNHVFNTYTTGTILDEEKIQRKKEFLRRRKKELKKIKEEQSPKKKLGGSLGLSDHPIGCSTPDKKEKPANAKISTKKETTDEQSTTNSEIQKMERKRTNSEIQKMERKRDFLLERRRMKSAGPQNKQPASIGAAGKVSTITDDANENMTANDTRRSKHEAIRVARRKQSGSLESTSVESHEHQQKHVDLCSSDEDDAMIDTTSPTKPLHHADDQASNISRKKKDPKSTDVRPAGASKKSYETAIAPDSTSVLFESDRKRPCAVVYLKEERKPSDTPSQEVFKRPRTATADVESTPSSSATQYPPPSQEAGDKAESMTSLGPSCSIM